MLDFLYAAGVGRKCLQNSYYNTAALASLFQIELRNCRLLLLNRILQRIEILYGFIFTRKLETIGSQYLHYIHLYTRTSGKMSGHKRKQLIAYDRVKVDKKSEDQRDFLLEEKPIFQKKILGRNFPIFPYLGSDGAQTRIYSLEKTDRGPFRLQWAVPCLNKSENSIKLLFQVVLCEIMKLL